MSQSELEFFNTISGQLDIQLTEAPENVGDLLNLRASETAELKSIDFVPEIFEEDKGEFRGLTDEEFDRIAFKGSTIKLAGDAGDPVTHAAPNGEHFTVRQLLDAVVETERQIRGNTEWLGGIDVHHIFFEGIYEEEPGIWQIYWGS